MSSSSVFNLPCKSFKSQAQLSILCSTHFSATISKHKVNLKHQILRNSKFQPMGKDLRLNNTERNRNMVVCESSAELGPEHVIPSGTPPTGPGSWKAWILGILMSIILPMWRGKWRPLLKYKQEVETVIDTVEAVTDIVEKVAEEVEKVADEVGDILPEGKLKDALEIVEDLADETADGARVAGDFVDKVEDMVDQVEQKVESLMKSKSNSGDEEAKEKKEKAN